MCRLRRVCFERRGQPRIELHFFAVGRSNTIRLSGQQTFARGKTNKIFRRFDFVFEMLVLRFDVTDRFLRRVGLSVADKSRVRVRDVIEEIVNRIVQRFGARDLSGRERERN